MQHISPAFQTPGAQIEPGHQRMQKVAALELQLQQEMTEPGEEEDRARYSSWGSKGGKEGRERGGGKEGREGREGRKGGREVEGKYG